MGSRRGLAPADTAIASVAACLVDADSDASILDRVGRVAATVIERQQLAIDPATTPIPLDGEPVDVPDELVGPDIVGLVYEQLLGVDDRRRRGAHFTPPGLAQRLLEAAVSGWSEGLEACIDGSGGRIVDPSCGGGVFIVSAARWLASVGVDPDAVVGRVGGVDIAPEAVAVSQLSLALWLASKRPDTEPVAVSSVGEFIVGDALEVVWPKASLVVGNPPFLSQLNAPTSFGPAERSRLRDRFGSALGPYTDPAWLFLLAAVEATTVGGRIMLIQPTSLLSARDGTSVRERLHAACDLVGMWLANERVFGASVDVWAPVLEPRADGARSRRGETALWAGAHVESIPTPPCSDTLSGADRWTSLCADIDGVPAISWPRSERCIADVATVTAGFRDQFYGFVPHTHERSRSDDHDRAFPRLVTVGMIDPLRLRWGTTSFRFAGASVIEPVVDRESLAASDASLAAWLDQRLRPKLLVATQTKVLEVVVDGTGTLVPATPCLSIEPFDDDPDLLWELAAVLSAPALTVMAKRASMGAALSSDAIKVSARAVAALPMPARRGGVLEAGAQAAREASRADNATDWGAALDRLGAAMGRAYGVGSASETVTGWWRGRCPRWR